MKKKTKNSFGTLKVLPQKNIVNFLDKKHTISKNDLSEDQRIVYDQIYSWVLDKSKDLLKVGGYAGTGKTTLLTVLADELINQDYDIAFCAYTGKAANVLRQKLYSLGLDSEVSFCGTIHSLIYIPIVDEKTGEVVNWRKKEGLDHDLVIVDEASMIDQAIFQDLMSFGCKILAVGDHGQLPPIGEGLNLMADPDLRLEKIHRQAEGNPIISASAQIRNGTSLFSLKLPKDSRITFASYSDLQNVLSGEFKSIKDSYEKIALCYFNKTRNNVNSLIRKSCKIKLKSPAENDTVICLRNTKFNERTIYNGMRGTITDIKKSTLNSKCYQAIITFEDDGLELRANINKDQFGSEYTFNSFLDCGGKKWTDLGMLFDWGYCLTVHKAQGSQYDTAIVIIQRPSMVNDEEYRRWLYTAITRASEKLIFII